MTNKYVIHQKEIIENNYLKVVVPLNTMPDASTHVDTESDPASSSFDADIDSDYPTSSAFSMVCTRLPCSNAKLISHCLGGL